MDLSDYKPNEEVQSYLKDVNAVCVVGPTAVGKSTVINEAVELDDSVHLIRSTTSRPQRPGERDGVDMHFRSKAEMVERTRKREYVNVVSTFDNLYGTAPEDYAATGVSVLPTLSSAVPQFRGLPFASFRVVFVLPPSFEVWQERITQRHIAPQQLQLRMAEAADSLAFALASPDVLFVLNDALDVATEAFLQLIHGVVPDQDQQLACRELADELLAHVSKITKQR